MRYFVLYLVLVAIVATMVTGLASAAMNDVTCTLGSYGAVVDGCPPR
jgi:hypothetical protein